VSRDAQVIDFGGAAAVAHPVSTTTEPPRTVVRTLLRSPTFVIGMAIIVFWVVCAIFGPQIVPHSPFENDLRSINQPPSSEHWFGTDRLGRDMFSRVIVGSRDILLIAPAATLLGTAMGTALGLAMGYFRGLFDTVVGRVVETFLALPLTVTALLGLVAVGASRLSVLIVIGIVFTPLIARTVRTVVLLERELDYVAAARLRGERSLHVMFAEILPNVLGPVLVEFTVRLGFAVFTIATLSFLGFGVQPPAPDWGLDISANYGLVAAGYWWAVLFDALAIASLVVSANLVADAVQGALEQ
jgi:peptide/nickel transport system permease protein